MTDAVQIALITAIPPTIVAALGAWVSLMNSRGIGKVNAAVNGQNKALMKVARSDSYRKGKAAEKANPGSPVRKPKLTKI